MKPIREAALAATLLLLGATASLADAPRDLANCQTAVAVEARKYLLNAQRSLDQCLKRMSKAVVARGATPESAAANSAKVCMAALRKFRNGASPTSELGAKLAANVAKRCDPTVNPKLTHAPADVWTVGATTLAATNVGKACRAFGGDGTVDGFADWRDCVQATVTCEARQGIALQWPRALEYFAALKTAIAALPADDKRADALAALSEIDAAIEGATDDDVAELECGTGSARFVDNGDGTISDRKTGLMWQKFAHSRLDASAPRDWWRRILHDVYAMGLARYTDWRMPNVRELESLVDVGRSNPATHPAFDESCTAGCSELECSCTPPEPLWTSTLARRSDDRPYVVSFADGSVSTAHIESSWTTRAVRGGTVDTVVKVPVPVVLEGISLRYPWKSPCLPITLTGYDFDSSCVVGARILSLPVNGFLTQYIQEGGFPPGCEPIPGTDYYTSPQPYGRFQATVCYIPFLSTFTGFDSFTFDYVDREGNVSNTGTVSIEIFED